jgi:hypothetical protein
MTEIRDFFLSVFNARQNVNSGASEAVQIPPSSNNTAPQTAGEIKQRTVRDTVKLSEGGQKIVNLARGNELANEFRNAPVDKDFATTLSAAFEDISRVARLFTETFKAAFSNNREKP